jgi:hypothetical protein
LPVFFLAADFEGVMAFFVLGKFGGKFKGSRVQKFKG